jgi:hypothetical protein
MKKIILALAAAIVFAGMAAAQVPTTLNSTYAPTSDVLGAHLVYGRGCVACHAPHSGARGNGIATADATSGDAALWGMDVNPYYSQTFAFGDGGKYPITTPANMAAGAHDPAVTIMLCLSCHDGNLAVNGMMKGTTVETIPNAIGGHAPTWLGNDGGTKGDYKNDHPVGPLAVVGCGGKYDWDCTVVNGKLTAPAGSNFFKFQQNYGFTVSTVNFAGSTSPAVACTTCHDQHVMNVYAGTIGGQKGTFRTFFFVRGPYDPTTGGNNVAQFCRQCHGGEANESHNGFTIPTT